MTPFVTSLLSGSKPQRRSSAGGARGSPRAGTAVSSALTPRAPRPPPLSHTPAAQSAAPRRAQPGSAAWGCRDAALTSPRPSTRRPLSRAALARSHRASCCSYTSYTHGWQPPPQHCDGEGSRGLRARHSSSLPLMASSTEPLGPEDASAPRGAPTALRGRLYPPPPPPPPVPARHRAPHRRGIYRPSPPSPRSSPIGHVGRHSRRDPAPPLSRRPAARWRQWKPWR